MSEKEIQAKPTKLLWLAPIFMSFLGGILMYIAVKDENKEMANDAMFISLVSTIGWAIVYVLVMILVRRSFPF